MSTNNTTSTTPIKSLTNNNLLNYNNSLNNSKFFILSNDRSIEIYRNFNLIHIINDAHLSTITSIIQLENQPFKFISSSLDGYLKLWDALSLTCIRFVKFDSPVTHSILHSVKSNSNFTLFVALNKLAKRSKTKDGKERSPTINTVIFRVNWSNNSHTLKAIGQTKPLLTLHSNQDTLIGLSGKKLNLVHLYQDKTFSPIQKWVSDERHNLSIIDPLNEYIVTTESVSGKIHLWPYELLKSITQLKPQLPLPGDSGEANNAPTQILHWHPHQVNALTFTPSGSFLLSGGQEGVLVRWHIRQTNGTLTKRDFLPRLGAPIAFINCFDEFNWLVGLIDGTKLVIDSAQWKVKTTIRSLLLNYTSPNKLSKIPISINEINDQIILPSSHPSSLQIYSLSSNKSQEFEVAPSNRIASKNINEQMANITVEISKVYNNLMATCESFDGRNYAIKIWNWDQNTNKYLLNTRIDKPHGESSVNSLDWSSIDDSKLPILVSSGTDHKVRVWRPFSFQYKLKPLTKKSNDQKQQQLQSQYSYNLFTTINYKDQKIRQVMFSPDGTLLVLVHDYCFSLWNPLPAYSQTNGPTLVKVISCVNFGGRLNEIAFIGKRGKYLGATLTVNNKTDDYNNKFDNAYSIAIIWDLSKCQSIYHYTFSNHSTQIISHPYLDQFGVVSTPKKIKGKGEKSLMGDNNNVMTKFHAFNIDLNGIKYVKTFELDYAYRTLIPYPNLCSKVYEKDDIMSNWTLLGVKDSNPFNSSNKNNTGLDVNNGVVLIGNKVKDITLAKDKHDEKDDDKHLTNNLFEEIFGKFDDHLKFDDDNQFTDYTNESYTNSQITNRNVKNMFDGPSHLLPGPQIMYNEFLNNFLPKKRNNSTNESTNETIINDQQVSNMDVDNTDENVQLNGRVGRIVNDDEINHISTIFKEII